MKNFLACCSRNWFPLLIYLVFLLPVIAGLFGLAFGLPYLFRDDPQLRSDGVIAVLRNSPAAWGHAAATLLILTIWTGIYLREEIRSGGGNANFPGYVRYLARNASGFIILLPIAAAFPPAGETGWLGILVEIGESLLGIAYALAIVGIVGFLIRRFLGVLLSHPRGMAIVEATARMGPIKAVLENPSARSAVLVALFAVAVALVTGLFTVWPVIMPSVALCVLFIWIVAIYFLVSVVKPVFRFPITLVLIAAFFVAADDPFPNHFPGFAKTGPHAYRYDNPRPVGGGETPELAASAIGISPDQTLDAWRAALIDPETHLKAACGEGAVIDKASRTVAAFQGDKPKIVVVAVSGGAYRAGFWTAKVLDRLIELSAPGAALEGFASHIRLLTGASGGMVASAYLAAVAPDPCDKDASWQPVLERRLRADIDASRSRDSDHPGKFKTWFPIDRDSLGPVAQQILQRDIPRYVLSPFAWFLGLRDWAFAWAEWGDRGWVLEQQWNTLAPEFADLERGERQGWRPSIIFSPMMVETGQPLLISNLDLSGLVENSDNTTEMAIEFFRWFPEMRGHLKVQTAVRMNASFPYVSPAVSLPTDPPRRVVDAGYYDNYGINPAVSWLSQPDVIAWLRERASGVILIQIRAFQTPAPQADQGAFARRLGIVTRWLTSPIEGAMAARSSSMVFRNDQQIAALRDRLDPGFLETVIFENRSSGADIEMSWYVRCRALELMDHDLARHDDVLAELARAWGPGRPVTPTALSDPCPPPENDPAPAPSG